MTIALAAGRAVAGPLAERGLGGDAGLGLLGGGQVPVEDLSAVPVQHALEPTDMVVDRFEILDAMRLAADVGMDRKRHDLGPALSLGIEPVELIDRAPSEIVALVVLDDHHR